MFSNLLEICVFFGVWKGILWSSEFGRAPWELPCSEFGRTLCERRTCERRTSELRTPEPPNNELPLRMNQHQYKMKRFLLPFYLLLSLLNLYGEYSRAELLIFITKPLLLTTLALWFYQELRPISARFPRYILAGLIFSIGGDVLLMLVENGPKNENFFLLGLGSFLLAQLSYMLGFVSYPEARHGLIARTAWRAWPFGLFLAGMFGILWPGLSGPMRAPVGLYACAIVGMATAAFNLRPLVAGRAFRGLMAGILLFLLSDSLIALNKFRADMASIPYARLLIMATYLLGQYWIARHAAAIWRQERKIEHGLKKI